MQGKLANSVFLRRDKQHFYPQAIFSKEDISIAAPSGVTSPMPEQIESDSSVEEAEEEEKKKETPSQSNLITKWIKDANG